MGGKQDFQLSFLSETGFLFYCVLHRIKTCRIQNLYFTKCAFQEKKETWPKELN